MMEKEHKSLIIAGFIGLLGAVLGSAVSGYFTMKSHEISAEQQQVLLARQLASTERQEVKKTLSGYLDLIGDYYQLITSNKIRANELDAFGKKTFNSAAQIGVLLSIDLGQKTFELNKVFMANLAAKSKHQYKEEMEEEVVKKIAEWMLVAKGELKILEYSASPDNLTIDAVRLLLQGAGSKKSPQTQQGAADQSAR